MTTGNVYLAAAGTGDDARATERVAIPRFWLFQVAGWLAYAVVMTLSRLSIFPLRYMLVSKFALAGMGFVGSLILWRCYRRLFRRRPGIVVTVVVSVVLSYAVALLWTAADNLVDIPIGSWLLDREREITSVFGLFVGSVYNAFTMLAWSLLYFGIRYYEALQSERERSLRAEALAQKAQLEALRYQIHPHFLFNTLNAVSTLVVEGRNDEASRMIARLSDFLRLTLTGPVAEESSLGDEIEFVRRYLEIEQVRFGDRLTTRIDVADDAWDARVPHLILQPLIENAIRHGVALHEHGGCVAVSVRQVGEKRVRIEVANGGNREPETGNRGIGQDPTFTGAAGGLQIGLTNTRQRLRHLYGDDHRFDVETEDDVVRVVLEIPFDAPGARG